jgi:hypothetical protein
LLRDKAYAVDDHITVPMINDFYEYLLLDPNVPDDEKGDFDINARGSIAMVEKAIHEKTLMQMLGVSLNPAYGADPKRVFNELLKTKRLDPRKVNFTEEEVKEQQSKEQPQPVQVQVATIRAQADLQKTDKVLAQKTQSDQLDAQTTMRRAQLDTDRDTVYVQAQTARDQANQELGLRKLFLERELAIMEYASQHQVSLDEVRARLAETAMKLNTQKELSMAAMGVDIHKHQSNGAQQQVVTPPTEPAGRAPNGQAFEA